MALTAAKKKLSPELEKGREGTSAREVWVVTSDTVNPSEASVLAASGLPQANQSHASNYNLQVARRTARQVAPKAYEVDVEYAVPSGTDTEDDEENPLDKPAVITRRTVFYQEAMDQDAEGTVVETVNFEPYDPPLMVEFADTVLTVTKNFATFDEAAMAKFRNKCNAVAWRGYPPYTCRVIDITDQEHRGAGNVVLHHTVSVSIQIRNREDPDGNVVGWGRRVIERGFRVWTGEMLDPGPGREYKHYEDKNGPVAEPVLLAEDGQKLAGGEDPVFYVYKPYKTIDYGQMNLGV
jgi:hypothetical protein